MNGCSHIKCKVLCSGPEAVRYIVNHAAVRAIFCDTKTLNIVSTEYGLSKTKLLRDIGLQKQLHMMENDLQNLIMYAVSNVRLLR